MIFHHTNKCRVKLSFFFFLHKRKQKRGEMQQRFGFLALPEKKDSRPRIGDELQGNSEKKPSFLLPILILVIEMKKNRGVVFQNCCCCLSILSCGGRASISLSSICLLSVAEISEIPSYIWTRGCKLPICNLRFGSLDGYGCDHQNKVKLDPCGSPTSIGWSHRWWVFLFRVTPKRMY